MEFAEAYSNIPEDHLGLLVGMIAVVGGLFVGLILGGISIWRGISLQQKLTEIRAQMVIEMLHSGLSSREILAIMDHPSMCVTTDKQRKQTRELVQTMGTAPMKVGAVPGKVGV